MTNIEFFKQQSKNLFKDYNTRVYNENEGFYEYFPRFFNDIEDILYNFHIGEDSPFTLMNAQHIIARLSGFYKWNELITASESALELGRLLLINREDYEEKQGYFTNIVESMIVADWKFYEQEYLKDFDDESKLEVFKRVFLEKQSTSHYNRPAIKINFKDAIDPQDMLVKIMKKKNLSSAKAILSSITQKNCIRIIETGYIGAALQMWRHDNPNAEREKLENPIVEIKLSKDKERLVNLIMEKEGVSFRVAILYFMLVNLESLGYHI
ncbi:MAG: hypothetical protein J6J24_02245 [Clostridia bacterium]|nr:hypothetical protein [Clostridia bacterium]